MENAPNEPKIAEISQDIVDEIQRRKLVFALDNLKFPSKRDLLLIEQAMLIGASIILEKQAFSAWK